MKDMLLFCTGLSSTAIRFDTMAIQNHVLHTGKVHKIVMLCTVYMLTRYPDNSPPGQFAPDNSPPIFKQLALCSFIHYRAKQDVQCMEPRLNAIEIILRSLIHYQKNNSSFFYPLPSLKFGGELSGANCPGGELSDIHSHFILIFCVEMIANESKLNARESLTFRLNL